MAARTVRARLLSLFLAPVKLRRNLTKRGRQRNLPQKATAPARGFAGAVFFAPEARYAGIGNETVTGLVAMMTTAAAANPDANAAATHAHAPPVSAHIHAN